MYALGDLQKLGHFKGGLWQRKPLIGVVAHTYAHLLGPSRVF